ncbi:MAG: helix-turn-helix transcriptional regulator [Defluviitaleaceae bacterium]|nr:helix-turn-helix transcriptional regulator [Defluviitaleaceae bacterium]
MMDERQEVTSSDFINEKMANFGANMRAARKQRGFSSEALASFLRFSTPYVGHIERGERRPSLENFLKICEFFGESPDAMLKPKGVGEAVRETKLDARGMDDDKLRRRQKMILHMLETFDPVELDHIISMIKSFKSYTDMLRDAPS